MRLRRLRFPVLLVIAAVLSSGCKTTDSETTLKDTSGQSIPGIAKYFFGVHHLNTGKVQFESGHTMDFYDLTQNFSQISGTGGMALRSPMEEVKSDLSFSASNFRDCLKNPKAAGWADISAHYYCIYPYTIRYCYSSVLAETRSPVKAFSYCSDSANKADWDQNRDTMFKQYGPGTTDWTWLLQNQKDVFVYLMFTQPGVKDFNIESQNRVINKFYDNVAGFTRQSRASDPYPN